MSNPWNQSLEDITLRSLKKFLDYNIYNNELDIINNKNEIDITNNLKYIKSLDDDPNDIISKLRLADKLDYKTLEYRNKQKLYSEVAVLNDITRELVTLLSTLEKNFEIFNNDNNLKISLLYTIRSQTLISDVQLSSDHKIQIIECIRLCNSLTPKVTNTYYKQVSAELNDLEHNIEEVSYDQLNNMIRNLTIQFNKIIMDLK